MIVLDTDHLSFRQHPGSPEAVALVNKLQQTTEDAVFTTIVSLEEQLRSWLNVIGRYRDSSQQVAYYPRLREFFGLTEDLVFDFVKFLGNPLKS